MATLHVTGAAYSRPGYQLIDVRLVDVPQPGVDDFARAAAPGSPEAARWRQLEAEAGEAQSRASAAAGHLKGLQDSRAALLKSGSVGLLDRVAALDGEIESAAKAAARAQEVAAALAGAAADARKAVAKVAESAGAGELRSLSAALAEREKDALARAEAALAEHMTAALEAKWLRQLLEARRREFPDWVERGVRGALDVPAPVPDRGKLKLVG